MSRHVVADANFELVVGWDPPLETYFAQIREPGSEIADEVIGGGLRELDDTDQLMRALPWRARRLVTSSLELVLGMDRDEGC